MSDLMNFNFESHEIRTVLLNGEPWFVAKDVCDAVQIDVSQTRRLDADEKGLHSIQTLGGVQDMLCVNEYGLYSLVLGSRKPEAKTFKRWITHDVIPTIRKTGSYSVKPTIDISKLSPEMQMFHHVFESVAKTQLEVGEVKKAVQVIQDTFLHRDPDWRRSINSMIAGAAYRTRSDYREMRNQSYEILEERGRCDLATRLRNLKKRLEESGATKTQISDANRMDVIECDPRLKEIYSTVVKELSIGSLRIAR
ncbi:BRO-N domain-containing protein [Alicyclobacillus fastidiosus]|uniref:BRO family protein n=1 Tax=Alicyclobacillus fastidiosus TaxID=392011 RepID=A0ABV5AK89_9BACL|nr:BRO family protein [Alicyclobacillus fastidiosus]WEH09310.1 BRO family protein [Alicyclobacillus fastidiosus]